MNKYKPSKSVAKRFRASKTGKLKRHHCLTSHLMSSRSGNKRRKLRKSAVLAEGHSRNMRLFMGISKLKPRKIAAERALRAMSEAEAGPETEQTPETTGAAATSTKRVRGSGSRTIKQSKESRAVPAAG